MTTAAQLAPDDRVTRSHAPLGTDDLARFLIGVRLMRRLDDGSLVGGTIVETEAYTADDPASHSYRGPTRRNRTMFGASLHAYVYFIYGTAYCLNVTSEAAGTGAAVLIRALEPLEGLPRIREHRGPTCSERDLLRGPGRVCQGLAVDRELDGADLERDDRLWLSPGTGVKPAVGVSVRIGLSRAAEMPRRYYACGSRFLSGPRSLSPR